MTQDHLLNRIRNLFYFGIRYPWVKHGRNVHVQWSTRMWSPHRNVVIGHDVGIGRHCTIQCDLEIGNKVLIAGAVAFIGSDDHIYNKVGEAMWDCDRGDARKTIVEDDVWIGWGAIVLSGARIGRGSIIAAGSVVVGDVPPYTIMVPQKARALRTRFSQAQAAQHEAALRPTGLFANTIGR